jgi:hypothetical protein
MHLVHLLLPLNVEAITRRVVVAERIDPDDRRVRAAITESLRWPVERVQAVGAAVKIGWGGGRAVPPRCLAASFGRDSNSVEWE